MTFTYPHGKRRALTFSYDDGTVHDRRLVDIFNQYGMKGTFHLNSGNLGKEGFLTEEEIPALFSGHEISCHSCHHPNLLMLEDKDVLAELTEDRRRLERLAGYPVTGMSYPYGDYDRRVLALLVEAGIVYSRTTKAHRTFKLPYDFLEWHPTCHHTDHILERWEEFLKSDRELPLFYIWGHSYEFDRQDNWDLIETFCQQAGGREDVWYATNKEIMEYLLAIRRLEWSMDKTRVHNPSAISVFVQTDGGELVEIGAGQTVVL